MQVYTTETSHFSFQTVAEDDDHFIQLFSRAWRVHCAQCNISYNSKFVKQLIDEDTRSIYLELGRVYVDDRLLYEEDK